VTPSSLLAFFLYHRSIYEITIFCDLHPILR
jgi:hypothetical protein